MANLKISELTAAGALTGAELVEIVQGGVNKKSTTQDIADLGGGGGGSGDVVGPASATDSVPVLFDGTTGKLVKNSTPTGTGNPVLATAPTLSNPIVGTQSANDNSTKAASTAYADAKVADAINNGTTAIAPSQNAVFDALALKLDSIISFRRLEVDHTLDATDLASVNAGDDLIVEMNVGSANTLTIPLNSAQAFPIGTKIKVKQYGGGATTIAATGGVTTRFSAGVATIGGQYCEAKLEKVDTNEWYVDNGDPTVLSGTWTPTLTNTTNIAASTAYLCSYSRIGNRVTFSGRVDVDPTSTGSVVLGMSMPVASAFTQAYQAGGAAFSPGVAGHGAAILADATNDRLTLQFITVDVANQAFYFTGGYEVI